VSNSWESGGICPSKFGLESGFIAKYNAWVVGSYDMTTFRDSPDVGPIGKVEMTILASGREAHLSEMVR
jgi:hypothetical protein